MKKRKRSSQPKARDVRRSSRRWPFFWSSQFDAAYSDERWEKGGKGVCGPAVVTIASRGRTGADFQKVLDGWDGGYKGKASPKDIERELKKRKISVERMARRQKAPLALPEGVKKALVFIEWEGARHWLYLERLKGKLHGACSECKHFTEDDKEFADYVKPKTKNYMRSYLVLERT